MFKCLATNFRKKYYYIISAVLLVVLLSLKSEIMAAEPKAIKKEDFGGWDEGYVTTANDITGPTMSASGSILATIDVMFHFEDSTDKYSVSYIDVYRATSKNGKYKRIGSVNNDEGSFCFSDTTIDPIKKYYYYGIAYWKATETTPAYYSTKSPIMCGLYGMAIPHFYTQNNGGKNITLCFSDTSDNVQRDSFAIAQSFESDEKYCNPYWTGIQIYRSTKKSSGYKKIATITQDKATYVDKKVSDGTVYYYKTRGYYKNPKTGKVTYSEYSYPHLAKSGGAQNVNLNLKVERLSSTSFKISWDNSKSYSQYAVECQSNQSGGEWIKGVVKTSGNRCYSIIKGLKKGDSYYVRVNAMPLWGEPVTEGGHTYPCYHWCSYDTIYETNLNAPKNLSSKLVSASLKTKNGIQYYTGKYKLTWDKVDGASGYRIYKVEHTPEGEKRIKIATCKGNSKTSVEITLKDYTGRIYVQAYSGKEVGESSIYIERELKSPSASKIKIKKNGKKGTTISWSSMAKYGATSYKVYRYNNRLDRSYFIGETTKTSIKDTELNVKGTYTYLIVPCNKEFGISGGGTYKKYAYK